MPASEDGPTVIVIDDDLSVRDTIAGMLTSVGLRARTYASAQAFLRAGPLTVLIVSCSMFGYLG
jgi:FixJ family two-component response regulator